MTRTPYFWLVVVFIVAAAIYAVGSMKVVSRKSADCVTHFVPGMPDGMQFRVECK